MNDRETSGPSRSEDLSDVQFRALADAIPNLAWVADPDGWIIWYNRRWYEYTGTTPAQMMGWGWQAVHHPDVLPEMLRRWTDALRTGEPFEMTFPLRRGSDGSFRMFMTRAEPLREDGRIVGWYGSNTDITEQERTRERLQMAVNELNHRVKNTLATVQAIAHHSFRSTAPQSYRAFEDRLLALSAVHDLLVRASWTAASISETVSVSVASFDPARFDCAGEDVSVPPALASALVLTLHELCTNAAKYGALSAESGRVGISWRTERRGMHTLLALSWKETGGPPVSPPSHEGFGLRLIRRAAAVNRGASVHHVFEPSGVRCTIEVPLEGPAN